MIQLGLVSVTFRDLSTGEIVDLASSCGLTGIEWGADIHVPVGDLTAANDTRSRTCDAGLKVVSYGSYYRSGDERFEDVVVTAAQLGAPNIRVWAGKIGSAETSAAVRATIVDNLRRACELAARVSLTVSVEFHAGTLSDTLDSALQLLKEVSQPNLRLYWQPFPERSHEERLAEIRGLLPHLSNIHVFQWTRPATVVERHNLADGATEWPEYLKLAAGNRYALLEFVPNDDPKILAAEAATLRRWLTQNP